ncbi:MAG: hypothetical protein RLY78_4113, partial [Pseudomonadota bacterium]
ADLTQQLIRGDDFADKFFAAMVRQMRSRRSAPR